MNSRHLSKCAIRTKTKRSSGVNIVLDGSEILNGYFPVILALQSQLRQIYRLFITNQKLSPRQEKVVHLATQKEIPVQYVESWVLNHLSQREDKERGVHQGICADVSRIPLQRLLSFNSSDMESPRTEVLLCGVRDPFNVGSILRSSYYLGIHDVLISEEYMSASLSPVVSKASSGTLEIHPPKLIDDPLQYLSECLQTDGRVIGVDSAQGVSPKTLSNMSGKNKILLLGNEGYGIPKALSKLCSDFVKISPGRKLHPDVDSLNVSSASAILINELMPLVEE